MVYNSLEIIWCKTCRKRKLVLKSTRRRDILVEVYDFLKKLDFLLENLV